MAAHSKADTREAWLHKVYAGLELSRRIMLASVPMALDILVRTGIDVL